MTETTIRTDSEATTGVAGWKRVLGYLGGAFLGAILLLGAYTKVLDPLAFHETIRSEGLDFLLPASWVAMIAFALEAGLGTALILGVRRLWVLLPSAGLVVFFLFLTGRAYYRFANGIVDESASCGCFGNLVDRTPAEAFWQDAFLMVPALLIAFLGWQASQRFPVARLAAVLVATFGTVGLAAAAPGLPLDDLATRMKPGVQITDICTGKDDERLCLSTLIPQLETGDHLVVLADLDDSLGEAVPALNEVALSGDSLVVISSAEPEAHHAFFWSWGPAFEIKEAPPAMLKPLYRTLPRSFRLSEGEVVETFAGLPPLPEPEAAPDSQLTDLAPAGDGAASQ